MHNLKLPIRRGGFTAILHQVLDADNKEIAVITSQDRDVAKSIIDLCNLHDASKVEPHNKIITSFLCTTEYDGHEFDCYGTQVGFEPPEVEQIAYRGGVRDITHITAACVIASICADIERQWLAAQKYNQ